MSAKSDHLVISVQDHVAQLIFHRPPANHVSVELVADIADALLAFDKDPAVRATVLASEGKPFCAGADLASPTGIGGAGMGGVSELYDQAVRLFSVEKPIVAAVQGAAVGAGLGLALVADFRVAAHEARFSANFVKLGFHPGFGLTHTLPRVIGAQRADLMFLTGRRAAPVGLRARRRAGGECAPGRRRHPQDHPQQTGRRGPRRHGSRAPAADHPAGHRGLRRGCGRRQRTPAGPVQGALRGGGLRASRLAGARTSA